MTLALREALRVKEIIPATKVSRPFLESKEHKESGLQLTINPQQDQQVPPREPEMVVSELVTAKYETTGSGLSPEAADRSKKEPCPEEAEPAEETTGALPRKNELPVLNALAHLPPVYILAAGGEGLYIVDQHAAHERILYESYLNQKGPKQSQCLLIPLMLELDYRDATVLTQRLIWFSDAGFILEHFGGNSFLLRGVPTCFPAGQEKNLFLDLLDYFRERGQELAQADFEHQLYASIACRNAVKAGEKLSKSSMDALLESLAQTENPFTCPHGRPTIIHLSYRDLENRFKR
ncbi:MAG: hypothetical protein GXY90_06770 [Peptococcaceae bacterium]|nr:hypothetical protein [Peptococcaceae bacterium]